MRWSIPVIALGVLVCGVSSALAHDGNLNTDFDNWAQQTLIHNEPTGTTDPNDFKGWAYVSVYNSSLSNYWTDFHFEIVSAPSDATQVYFVADPPTLASSQSPFSYVIGTNGTGHSTLDFYFPADAVAPGETATFNVYTDNTAVQNAWFGIAMWPTPEPATALLLGLSGLLFLRRPRR